GGGGGTATVLVRRQDFLIPRAANQLFRFRARGQSSCFEIWRTRQSPATSRRRWTRARCHHAKSPVCSTAGGSPFLGPTSLSTESYVRSWCPHVGLLDAAVANCAICLAKVVGNLSGAARLG